MALPLSRNTTYVQDVTPVKANDLNDIQDQIIAQRAVQSQVRFLNFIPFGAGNAGVFSGVNLALGTGAGTYYDVCFAIPRGCRVRGVRIQGVGNGADDVNIRVLKTLRGVSTNLHAAAQTWLNVPVAPGGSDLIVIDPAAAPSTIADGEILVVHFDGTTGANIVIYGITVEVDSLIGAP